MAALSRLLLSILCLAPMSLHAAENGADGLFSFHFRDHGARDGSPLEPRMRVVA